MRARIGLVIAATGLSVLACSDSGTSSTDGPVTYMIATVPKESARSTPPVVFIDGIAQDELAVQYPSVTDAVAVEHRVELRAGDTVLAAMSLRGADLEDCTFDRASTSVVSFTESVCEYDSGDLRRGAPQGSIRLADGNIGQCIIDGSASCWPECNAGTCNGGTHCTSIVTSHVPLYGHLGCAPNGSVPVGGACTFSAGSGGDVDNCTSGAVCVSGTCHALCTDACATCGPIDGEPGELSFCL